VAAKQLFEYQKTLLHVRVIAIDLYQNAPDSPAAAVAGQGVAGGCTGSFTRSLVIPVPLAQGCTGVAGCRHHVHAIR
jgi:hypothetical protein